MSGQVLQEIDVEIELWVMPVKEKGEEAKLGKERHRSDKDRPTQLGAPEQNSLREVPGPIPHRVQPLAGDAQEVCDQPKGPTSGSYHSWSWIMSSFWKAEPSSSPLWLPRLPTLKFKSQDCSPTRQSLCYMPFQHLSCTSVLWGLLTLDSGPYLGFPHVNSP